MFIERRPDQSIRGCWTVRQWEGQEELPDDSPEVVAFMAPKPVLDVSDVNNLDKTLQALALLTRQYANALKAGTFTTKAVADVKSDFAAIYRALP